MSALDIGQLSAVVGLALSIIALGGAVLGWFRWLRPKIQSWQEERRQERQRARDRDVVIFGRDAIPANPFTGEEGQDEIRPLVQIVRELHHELNLNSGKSMKDVVMRTEGKVDTLAAVVAEIMGRLGDGDQEFAAIKDRLTAVEAVLNNELVVANDTVANAAQASRHALEVIDAALHAEPPAEQ